MNHSTRRPSEGGAFSSELRGSLLSWFAGQSACLVGLFAFLPRTTDSRFCAVGAALLIPALLLLWRSPSIMRSAISELRINRKRTWLSAVAALLGAATCAAAMSLPVAVVSKQVGEVLEQAGPVDLILAAASPEGRDRARSALAQVVSRPDLQGLVDSSQLELVWVIASVETPSGSQPVRIIRVDGGALRSFGRNLGGTMEPSAQAANPQSRNEASSGQVDPPGGHIDAVAAAGLGVKEGGSLRILAGASPSELLVSHVSKPDATMTLLRLPSEQPSVRANVLVDHQTYDALLNEGWAPKQTYAIAVSLCGQTVPGSTVPCVDDALSSAPFVSRLQREVESILETTISPLEAAANVPETVPGEVAGEVAAEVDGEVGFDEVPFDDVVFDDAAAIEPESEVIAPSLEVRVEPVKQLVVDSARFVDRRTHRVTRPLSVLLALGGLGLVAAACFVDRRKRTAIERSVGFSAGMAIGTWIAVVMLPLGPAILFGSFGGAILATSLVSLIGSGVAPSAIQVGFSAATAGLLVASATTWMIASLFRRIPLVAALRGAPLLTAPRWRFPAVVLVSFAAFFAAWGTGAGWKVQFGLLLFGCGTSMLTWSITRSRKGVAVVGLLIALLSVWRLRSGRFAITEPTTGLLLLILAFLVIVGGVIGAYFTSAPGQLVARVGTSRADRLSLNAIRSRVATRPGPWALAPVIGSAILFASSVSASGVLLVSSKNIGEPSQMRSVLVAAGNDPLLNQTLAGRSGRSESFRSTAVMMSVGGTRGGVSGSSRGSIGRVPLLRRTLEVATAPDSPTLSKVIGSRATSELTTFSSLVTPPLVPIVVNGTEFELAQGSPISIGDRLELRNFTGGETAGQVVAIINEAPVSGTLWILQSTFDELIGGQSTGAFGVVTDRVVIAPRGIALDALRQETQALLVGRSVAVTVSSGSAGSWKTSVGQISDNLSVARSMLVLSNLFGSLGLGVLAARWVMSRRQQLGSVKVAALGPAHLSRSAGRDIAAHVGTAACIAMVVGLGIGWAILPQGTHWRLPWMWSFGAVALPLITAAASGRFPVRHDEPPTN